MFNWLFGKNNKAETKQAESPDVWQEFEEEPVDSIQKAQDRYSKAAQLLDSWISEPGDYNEKVGKALENTLFVDTRWVEKAEQYLAPKEFEGPIMDESQELFPIDFKNVKWKFSYYDRTACSKRYRSDTNFTHKVRTKEVDSYRAVQVRDGKNRQLVELKNSSDLNVHIKVGNTPEFTLPAHEAEDLYLALLAYHKLAKYGQYTRRKGSKNGK